MSNETPVPSDVEPDSIIDLANDCREVASVLGSHVDLRGKLPLARVPLDRLPFSFGVMPAEITDDLLLTVAGLEDY